MAGPELTNPATQYANPELNLWECETTQLQYFSTYGRLEAKAPQMTRPSKNGDFLTQNIVISRAKTRLVVQLSGEAIQELEPITIGQWINVTNCKKGVIDNVFGLWTTKNTHLYLRDNGQPQQKQESSQVRNVYGTKKTENTSYIKSSSSEDKTGNVDVIKELQEIKVLLGLIYSKMLET